MHRGSRRGNEPASVAAWMEQNISSYFCDHVLWVKIKLPPLNLNLAVTLVPLIRVKTELYHACSTYGLHKMVFAGFRRSGETLARTP